MSIKLQIDVNGEQVDAWLDAGPDECVILRVPVVHQPIDHGFSLTLNRRTARAAMVAAATYQDDRGLWWDGYKEALADLERAMPRDEAVALFVVETTKRFGLDAKHLPGEARE